MKLSRIVSNTAVTRYLTRRDKCVEMQHPRVDALWFPPHLPLVVSLFTTLSLSPAPQFCRLPETLGMPRAWLAGQMYHGSERQRWRERRPQSRWGSEGLQQTQRVREGNARGGCDHPGLASSNRLYLRQGRWSPPGPHTKQGKKAAR